MLGANGVLMDAFYTDVRADLADWRASRGLPADPMKAYAASGYQDQIAADRRRRHPGRLGRLSRRTRTSAIDLRTLDPLDTRKNLR